MISDGTVWAIGAVVGGAIAVAAYVGLPVYLVWVAVRRLRRRVGE